MSNIKKLGKAQWVYTCKACKVTAAHPDQFRAIESQQSHEKSYQHFGATTSAAIRKAFQPIMDAFGFGRLEPWQENVLARSLWEDLK